MTEFYPQVLPGLDAGWERVQLEVTFILDGPEETISMGFELRGHDSAELLALEARGARPLFASHDWIVSQVSDAVRIALRHLSPF